MYALSVLGDEPGGAKAIFSSVVIIDVFLAADEVLGGGLNLNRDFLPAGECFAADGNALNALPLQLLANRL